MGLCAESSVFAAAVAGPVDAAEGLGVAAAATDDVARCVVAGMVVMTLV